MLKLTIKQIFTITLIYLTLANPLIFGNNAPHGSDKFKINTNTDNDIEKLGITLLKNGNFVVAWTGSVFGSNEDIYGQVFEPSGTKTGGEFLINTDTNDNQKIPRIAPLSNGNFVVIWFSFSNPTYGLCGQILNPIGNKVGSEFQIDNSHDVCTSINDVSSLGNGNFVVAWEYGYDIYYQLFDSSGNKLGSKFKANTYTDSHQGNPSIATLSNDNFVVTWASSGQDGYDLGIYGQIFSSSGNKSGGEFQVNTNTNWMQCSPSIAPLVNNNFVTVWVTEDSSTKTTKGIFGQIFSSSVNKIGGEFQANTNAGRKGTPNVSPFNDGNFVVTWRGTKNNQESINAQIMDISGNKIGGEFQVTLDGDYPNYEPNSLTFNNEKFIIIWSGMDQNDEKFEVYGRIFDLSLYVSNIEQTLNYLQNIPKNLNIELFSLASSVSVTMTMSAVETGKLNSDASSNAVSSYDSSAAKWQASGTVDGVNALLAEVKFIPTINYCQDFSINVIVNDGATKTGLINMKCSNQAPTNGEILKEIGINEQATFSLEEFSEKFANGDTNKVLAKIKIISLPEYGNLRLLAISVTKDQEIEPAKIKDLIFTSKTDWSGEEIFAWQGHDGSNYSEDYGIIRIIVHSSSGSDLDNSWVWQTAIGVGGTVVAAIIICPLTCCAGISIPVISFLIIRTLKNYVGTGDKTKIIAVQLPTTGGKGK